MNNDPKNLIRSIVESSKKINSKVLTLTRCMLLALMWFNEDGLQFRELKTILDISDGKLKSNLDFLLELGYIKKIPIRLDQKDMHIYMVKDSGKNELKKIIKMVELIKKVEELKNGKGF